MSTKRRRCAIYTRKSTEEGLDQAFNSLAAQREACEAYIASQKHEGWKAIAQRFDDGGLSGATMNRPDLERLLTEVRGGTVDVIVVYKVDRLTRSLTDFARMVEIFDMHSVSFVSVTQQFNTTTSMGRLTLNVLLSFAQFEREVTAERIRDKIAASKRKGMWMGGVVPLGYDTVNRDLVINSGEAQTVRALFDLFLEYGSVARVKEEADGRGFRTKARTSKRGSRSGGEPFTRGHLYRLLCNPIYIGEIAHKEERFAGQHEPIIDQAVWDAVTERFKRNAVRRRSPTNTKSSSLLTNMLFDSSGQSMVSSYARKGDRRYRYYNCRTAKDGSLREGGVLRLPAAEVETVVVEGICDLLQDQRRLIEHLQLSAAGPEQLRDTIKDSAQLGKRLASAAAAERRKILVGIIETITVGAEGIRIEFRSGVLLAMLSERSDCKQPTAATRACDQVTALDLPIRLKRRGAQTKLVLSGESAASPDAKLISAIASGQAWFAELREGKSGSVRDIARRDGVDRADIGRLIRLAFLAPDIVEAILAGRQPVHLTVSRLKRLSDLPLSWPDQRRMLGFPS